MRPRLLTFLRAAEKPAWAAASAFPNLPKTLDQRSDVSGTASVALELGAAVRASQTGRIRNYVTALVVALAVLLAGAILVLLSTTGR